ncbi:MAG TPA: hypothetical protein VFI25_14540 [Planctomycetota bacterium]|jgi:hypothetical protein|nr:hypothetical protein [Planctomycetota bacterium]
MRAGLRLIVPAALLAGLSCDGSGPLPASQLGSLSVTPANVALEGIRLHSTDREGTVRTFREQVTRDGRGGGDIELVEIDGLGAVEFQSAGRAAEWISFANLYALQKSYLAKYRDFTVVDPELVLDNYAIEVSPYSPPVLGRSTGQARFRRKSDGRAFEVVWDLETGVVLDAQEFDDANHLVARTQYVSITFPPAPSPPGHLVTHGAPVDEDIPEGYRPGALPQGFRARRAYAAQIPGGEKARVDEYTDGIDRLFLVQRPQTSPSPTSSGPIEVRRLRSGVVEMLEIDLPGAVATVVGKLSLDDLRLVLASLRR